MRFTDGLWRMRDGVKAGWAKTLVDSKLHDKGVDLKLATKPIRHRGDTLEGPLLSINLTSPSEGVIGFKVQHFNGRPAEKPDFELFPHGVPTPPQIKTSKTDKSIIMESGPLSAVVSTVTGDWGINFVPTDNQSKILTFSTAKGQAVMDIPSKWTTMTASGTSVMTSDFSANPNPAPLPPMQRYMQIELNLGAGELIYGTGENFGPVIKNGQSVSIWNADGGTSSEQAYKCVPFIFSSQGYGVFVNHPGEVEFEIGSEKRSRTGIAVKGEELEIFIIYGPTPKDVLNRYTLMTGRPGLPPAWTFGLWLSTSFLTDYDSKTVSSFLQGMRDRHCDVRVFHFDCFWMKQYEWCNFTFDPDNFPDPAQYIKEIKEKYGVKVCVWINSYISQLSSIYQEGLEGGYYIKRSDGTPWQFNLWQPGLVIVDFTNPAACEWYAGKLRKLLDLGVDCFKTDFGERIPHLDVKFHDGGDAYRMHNKYTFLYNELVFNLLKERFGEHEACLFARSATAGGQRFPVHWGGDCESTWEAMAETIRGGLSLTLSGFGFASHDIGGFEGHPPREIYMRWCAYGAFSSHTRLHGSGSYRVPWNYDTETDSSASQALARFIDTKHRLMPYIYAAAIEANAVGVPVQRAMLLEFPEDRTVYYQELQYMFGPSILVAPVFTVDTEEWEYYIPAGRWTSFWDAARTIDGPQWIKEKVPYNSIPLWIRPGSIIATGTSGIGKPDWDYTKDVELSVYELADGETAEAVIPTGHKLDVAAVVKASRSGNEVKVNVASGDLHTWKATFVTAGSKVTAVKGGNLVDGSVQVGGGTKEIVIQLA